MKATSKTTSSLCLVLVAVLASLTSLCAGAELAVPNACMVVYDLTKPSMTLQGATPFRVAAGTPYSDPGATALDNMDGDVTARIVVVNNINAAVPGHYTIAYAVSDAAGNVAVPLLRTVVVYIPDSIKPVIVLNGSPSLTVEVLRPYADPGATATDNIDGDITSGIITLNSVNFSKLGTYTVTYDVTDSALNAAVQVVRTVKVADTTPPVITIK